MAALLPASHEVGHVRIKHASSPLVGRSWGRLGEVLVAVDGPGAYPEPLADVPEIRPRQVEAADVPPLLDEAFVALFGRLLDIPVVVPRSVRHDGPGSEVGVVLLFGRRLRRCYVAENGPLLEQVQACSQTLGSPDL